ncbi:hypothetical protein BRE01_35200 [Brevibacillus reuszeri]|uniref:Transposase n=1 Tax=Brevibacillus reuszeri TaxID=54915 RepID=A0ABQ0TPE7_9BACL|nr:hypothetical protein BRE01_35200 [Brevibacillus reuszeri]
MIRIKKSLPKIIHAQKNGDNPWIVYSVCSTITDSDYHNQLGLEEKLWYYKKIR